MTAYLRVPLRLALIAAFAPSALLAASAGEVPVVDVPPPDTAPPLVDAEAPPSEAETPPSSESAAPAAVTSPAARPAALADPEREATARARAAAPSPEPVSVGLAPLPSRSVPAGSAPPGSLGTDALAAISNAEGPVAVVPNASGTPIVLQPPVIEPPKVIDDPWTIARAIPWLVAGLLIGGSLALLLVRRKRRRRVVVSRSTQAEDDAFVELKAEPVTGSGPDVLVRKAGRPAAVPGNANLPG